MGFFTGLHPLVLACAKPLAHNQIAELVAKGLEKAMSPVATHSGMSSADTRRVAAVLEEIESTQQRKGQVSWTPQRRTPSPHGKYCWGRMLTAMSPQSAMLPAPPVML